MKIVLAAPEPGRAPFTITIEHKDRDGGWKAVEKEIVRPGGCSREIAIYPGRRLIVEGTE